jgi:5'-3' exonuclease
VRVHLVDGTYELFRAYFGSPSAESPAGQEVGAVRGLARSLLTLVRDEGATHVAVAFDTVIESFRNELFSGYKTGDGIDPDLYAQFPLAEEMARALGFVVWPMVEFEADDALASAARRYAEDPDVDQVFICSPDKDLAQMVDGQRIVCVDRRQRRLLDDAGVWEKFGVGPASIPDYLGLVGDAADGIPGVPRWGPKSASTLLAAYTHLEAIPPSDADWTVRVRGARGLAESLAEHREDAHLWKTLATLRTDVPIEPPAAALEWRGAHGPELRALAERLGDRRLIERVSRFASGESPSAPSVS